MIDRTSLQRTGIAHLMLFVLMSHAPLSADVVHLKNGNTLEGEVTERDDGQVVIDMPGVGSITFSMDDIESIEQVVVKETSSSSAEFGSRDFKVWAMDKSLNSEVIVSEISYRFPRTIGDVKESGQSLLEYKDRVEFREYQFPADVDAINNDPDKFYDRTIPLSKSRYNSMWGKLMRHSPKKGNDIWDTENETSTSTYSTYPSAFAPCEARIRKGSKLLVHQSYSCMNDAKSFFSLVFIIVSGSVPAHLR